MSLKDLANASTTSNIPKKDDEDMEKLKNSMLVDSSIQGSFYYIFGSINTFMRLKGYDEIAPDVVFKRLKEMNRLDKQELEESDDPLHKFLLFYFHEKN